ncbi:hypothetical protein C8P63_103106 [Melghirimyces profundicolus]|uniref:Uncharacterized protein n=1 Tax=Melghirimyces profundicolus TaxID=1242148 RepID=A0A2T6C7Q0_9BACL|nr:hypothetical protein [Melghirimyces profundicolus]PTX64322.1 hypothetical protein C8P63_103106 [Melghirimyces profundicolus]
MATWYANKGSHPVTGSKEAMELVKRYLFDVVAEKQVTKAEIKLMGYLVRKSLRLGEDGKETLRIGTKDWEKEAGLSRNEVDKTLAKCEERGWISIDHGSQPVSLRLKLRHRA